MKWKMTSLERKSGSALWQQIGEALERQIKEGVLPPGARMPTEAELMRQFDVSRSTIRRAMSTLEERGLVRIEQGRGTFVYDGPINYAISRTTKFSENLAREGHAATYEVRRVQEIAADETVAAHLLLEAGDPVCEILRLGRADDVPLSYTSFYYSARRFPAMLEKGRTIASQTALLAAFGVKEFRRLVTWITARPPSDEEARALSIPRSRWLLISRKVDVDAERTPVCYAEARFPADRMQYVIGETDGAATDPTRLQ